MSRRLASVVCCLAALVAGCGGSDSEPEPVSRPVSPFAYDASVPLAIRDGGRVNSEYPIAVRDVSFATGGKRVDGFLAVSPSGQRRRPAAIYLHGAGGDRGQLLLQAVWLAGRGAVTLTLTAPSSSAADMSEGLTPGQVLRRQRELAVADVVAVRRAVDLLRLRPDVDPERIGFLGWSLGARTGAVLAGVEPRLRALVLMSAGAAPISVYAAQAPAGLRPEIRRVLGEIDPLRYIAKARPGSLLLQNGRQDEVVARAALDRLAAAAPTGTLVQWYDAPHELDIPAQREQLDWLVRKLEIRGPAIPGARTGP